MRILTGLLAVVLSFAASAQQAPQGIASPSSEYVAGEHYEVLPEPVPTSAPDKIEVMEVFSYLCGHCFNFAPLLSTWEAEQGDDVAVAHTPAVWNRSMEAYARGYYTAKALGMVDTVHMPIFRAVHQEGKQFTDEEEWADFLASHGADREKALKTFSSWGVTQKVSAADQRVRNYKITGTPEMVVDGKYRVGARMAGSHNAMLRVVDHLVEKVRSEN